MNGNDVLYGEGGDDTLNGGLGNDTLNGGAGFDKVSYVDSIYAVKVELDAFGDGQGFSYSGTAGSSPIVETDTLVSFVDIEGSNLGDILTGNAESNYLYGNGGADNITGNAGADLILGGAGNDTIDGGAGNDVIDAGIGSNTVDGGADNDTIRYLTSTEGMLISLISEIAFSKVTSIIDDDIHNIENATVRLQRYN